MSETYFCAVIGKGFGDEGKGMAVDFLSGQREKVLVIRHNGGAQSGHTVELPGKRFVFHELSSGSFHHADTFWADTYFPDLYKLGEEVSAFRAVSGFVPGIYADVNASVTVIDDVLLNMAAEEARGAKRHGSCGMGIYEAQLRTEAGYGISIGELARLGEEELVARLLKIRKEYLPERLRELGLQKANLGEYGELLDNEAVLENTAREMLENVRLVNQVEDVPAFLSTYQSVIFENGQGLLLDAENETYAPHVTASRTGLTNPCLFLQRYGQRLDEVVYVTRSYVTRHGAGPLPNECTAAELGILEADCTNLENPWQGSLRYARHVRVEEFCADIEEDLKNLQRCNLPAPTCSLLITHLNETGNCIFCEDGNYSVEEFCEASFVKSGFDKFYLSFSRYGSEVECVTCSEGNESIYAKK